MEVGASSTELIEDKKKPSYSTQYLGAFSACLGGMCFGITMGYSSPAGEMLMGNQTTNSSSALQLDENQNGWFTSIVNIGAAVGGPIGGILVNMVGRKGSSLISAAVWILGWILTACSVNFGMLIASRIVAGLAMGITCIAVNTYIMEIASVDVRGMLGTGFQLLMVVGVEYVFVFAAFVNTWQLLAVICCIPLVFYFVFMFISKESPAYLLSKGKEAEARASLQFYRGKEYDIEEEFNVMKDTLEEARKSNASMKDLFVNNHLLKPLMISLGLMFFQQMSGVNAVIFNLATIFKEAGTDMSENMSSIIVGLVQVLATAVASQLVERAGRKLLLTCSAIIMTISLAALGVYFYENHKDNADSLGWLPLLSLMVFIMAFSLGYGPIPWLMMSELFPRSVAGAASGISTMENWIMSFTCTLMFVPLKDAINEYGVYWMFAGICFINMIFCILFVPETKGKTSEEISAYFGAPVNQKDDSTKNKDKEKEAEISVIFS